MILQNNVFNRGTPGEDFFFKPIKVNDYVLFTNGSSATISIGTVEEISKSKKTVSILNNGTSLIKRRCCEVVIINNDAKTFIEEHTEKLI